MIRAHLIKWRQSRPATNLKFYLEDVALLPPEDRQAACGLWGCKTTVQISNALVVMHNYETLMERPSHEAVQVPATKSA